MKCPYCGAESGVTDSRTFGPTVRRKRHCSVCKKTWMTIEMAMAVINYKSRTGRPQGVPYAHPTIQTAFEEKKRQGITFDAWAKMSGVSKHGLKNMRSNVRLPLISTLDAALEVLGFELLARRKKEKT